MATSVAEFESKPELKRKRGVSIDGTESNKRSFSQLPIRSPPSVRPSALFTRASSQPGLQAGLLTPESVSEESSKLDDIWSQSSQPQHSHSNSATSLSSASSSSLRVQIDNDETMDMEMSSPKLLRIGRARSNDIMSPARNQTTLLSAPVFSSEDRIPTPVASTFGGRNPYEAALASSRSIPSRTALTPMLTEESWTPHIQQLPEQQEPLSPDPDPDTMMIVEDTSNGLGALSVNCDRDDYPPEPTSHSPTRQHRRRYGLGLDNQTPPDASSRTARLHMGFRADCEKCVQRVPGHYSHIMWS